MSKLAGKRRVILGFLLGFMCFFCFGCTRLLSEKISTEKVQERLE